MTETVMRGNESFSNLLLQIYTEYLSAYTVVEEKTHLRKALTQDEYERWLNTVIQIREALRPYGMRSKWKEHDFWHKPLDIKRFREYHELITSLVYEKGLIKLDYIPKSEPVDLETVLPSIVKETLEELKKSGVDVWEEFSD